MITQTFYSDSGGPTDSFDGGLEAELAAVANFKPDLSVLQERIEKLVIEANREARLAGRDAFGDELREISEAGWKKRRQRGQGSGPPLLPDGEESRAIRNFICTTDVVPGSIEVNAGWVAADFLRGHALGDYPLPVRDIISALPEEVQVEIQRLIAEETDRQLAEAIAEAKRSKGILNRIGSFFGFGR